MKAEFCAKCDRRIDAATSWVVHTAPTDDFRTHRHVCPNCVPQSYRNAVKQVAMMRDGITVV